MVCLVQESTHFYASSADNHLDTRKPHCLMSCS